MTEIVTLVVPLFALIVLGAVAGLSPIMATSGRRVVDWLLLKLALPALLFQVVAAAPLSEATNLSYYFTVAFGTYCAFAIAFTFAALRSRGDIHAAGLAGAYGSHGAIAHLGPALVLPAFGPGAGVLMALIFFWDGIIIRVLLPILWAIGGRERPSLREVRRNIGRAIASQVALWAVVAGVVVSVLSVELPAGVSDTLTVLGSAAAPLGLIGLGLALMAHRRSASTPKLQFSGALLVKLFLQPAIVYLLLGWVADLSPIWMFSAVFLAALPPAFETAAIGRGGAEGEAVDPVPVTGLIISLVTITALIALTVQGVIPPDPFVSAD